MCGWYSTWVYVRVSVCASVWAVQIRGYTRLCRWVQAQCGSQRTRSGVLGQTPSLLFVCLRYGLLCCETRWVASESREPPISIPWQSQCKWWYHAQLFDVGFVKVQSWSDQARCELVLIWERAALLQELIKGCKLKNNVLPTILEPCSGFHCPLHMPPPDHSTLPDMSTLCWLCSLQSLCKLLLFNSYFKY